MRILVAQDVPLPRTHERSRFMGEIHDRIERSGYAVDYVSAEDIILNWEGQHPRIGLALAVQRQMRKARLAGRPYDIVNVHEPHAAAVSMFTQRHRPPALVVTTYGIERRAWSMMMDERRLGRGSPPLHQRLFYPPLMLWPNRYGFRQARHVFCLSEQDRAFLTDTYDMPDRAITRIFPGADALWGRRARDRDYLRTRTMLFAGPWRRNKGVQDLIVAATALFERHPDLELCVLDAGLPEFTIHGTFPERARRHVRVIRTFDDTETADAFAAADVFVLPSLFDGTPIHLMNAMMSGLPIVTTATGGMRDVIRHDHNGLLVPIRSPRAIDDAVDRLLRQPDTRERLGRAAQTDARERYDWDRAADPVLETYERLLG